MTNTNCHRNARNRRACFLLLWGGAVGVAFAQEQFQLTGITSVLQPKRAFVLVSRPGAAPQSCTFLDGQVLANGAFVQIDERGGCVTLRRGDHCETIRFNASSSSEAVVGDARHRPILNSAVGVDANP